MPGLARVSVRIPGHQSTSGWTKGEDPPQGFPRDDLFFPPRAIISSPPGPPGFNAFSVNLFMWNPPCDPLIAVTHGSLHKSFIASVFWPVFAENSRLVFSLQVSDLKALYPCLSRPSERMWCLEDTYGRLFAHSL